MKKSYLNIVFTLTGLLGLGISARAQDAGRVTVTVPFEFVVAGSKTMPAGTYSIGRVSPDSRSGLIIRSYDSSVLLLPIAFHEASAEQTKLSFEQVGDKYFLSEVETPAAVYSIETPRGITKLAQMKDRSTVPSSGN
jgi:hypothetical protein